MLMLRRIWVVLAGAWIAAWLANALFGWILDLDDTLVAALSIVAAVVGALAAVTLVVLRRAPPKPPEPG